MDAVMLARQRMLEREGEHVCRVILASVDAERRRKDRNNAKAKRFYARKSPEEKLELSRRKRGRMKELHGEGYYYGLSKAWRGTEKGKAQVTSYNRSESHRACERAYRARQMEKDREGFLAKDRERAARNRRRKREWALWALLTGLTEA